MRFKHLGGWFMRLLMLIGLLAWLLQPAVGLAETINLAASASGETERIEGHLDSLAALAILVSAIVVWFTQCKSSEARALGTATTLFVCCRYGLVLPVCHEHGDSGKPEAQPNATRLG